MEKANVVMIEDNQTHLSIVRQMLTHHDHIMSADASTTEDGLELIQDIYIGRFICDILVLDGNLTFDVSECRDAKIIMSRYSDYGLKFPIIGYSNSLLTDHGINIPRYMDIGKNVGELIKLINYL